jgi:hypothetical protein
MLRFQRASESRNHPVGRTNDEVDVVDVGGFSLTTGEVDVNVWVNFDVAFCDGLEEGRLGRINKVGGVRRNTTLAESILAPHLVVERDPCTLDE